MQIHVVAPNDTLSLIAQEYGITVELLMSFNHIVNPDQLVQGQALVIKKPELVHLVEPGENLYFIARKYNKTVIELLQMNPQLQLSLYLDPGQEVIIEYQDQPERNVVINGYVYPFVDREILQRNLPYLTYLSIFSYGFKEDGELVMLDDEEIIKIAADYGVAPILVLAPVDENGVFNNNMASKMLNNPLSRKHLIEQLLQTMKKKGYYGVDVDFEFILGEDREAFVQFYKELKEHLEVEGYLVFAALAPKTSADQQGVLYEAHDYRQIGNYADFVLVMTYEWGYTYSEPMAVAPVNKVSEVLRYAVTEIDPEKILMGIPNYGYDWKLPYEKGVTKARTIGNEEAVEMALEYQTVIQYDQTAQTPFFHYIAKNGTVHTVWFEDARSIEAKLQLIEELELTGAGYWNLMRDFRQNWMVLISMYKITKVI